ncbi:MAG TPA: hypothetical protein VFT22_43415 [Kofleriaceae bacterium]|nr:hypothetical protein [Kofleriaceae bacterium]
MRRGSATALVASVIAACNGSLREKVGQSDVDASVLMTIQPPMCDAPAAAADSGECTGGGVPGSDCLMCHHQGGVASPYTFAGTLYDQSGNQPLAGATIYVQDSAGNIATTVTRPNGNFYTADGFVTYPAKVFASLCPTVLEMVGAVDEVTGANCNTSGCHTAGFRVHLP